MPEFIQEHPNIRYKTIKTLLRTNLRAKTVVTRRGTPDDKTFIMVTAPNTTEDGSPNGVKDAVSKLLKLDHPNLVSVYEAYENEGYYYWIIRDWSLKMKASKRFGVSSLTEGQVAETMQDLAAAMLYMHKNGVEHGSLCFEDIQFTRKFDDTSDVLNVKIIDLGVGRHVDEKRYVKARQERRYGEPPELKDGKFSAKSDVWTLGSTAFRLLTGAISDEHNAELTKGGSSKELRDKTESISDEGTDFIERCLRENPEDRMAMEEAVNHKWFSCTDRESAPLSSDVMDALNQEDIRGAFMRRACPIIAKHLDDDEIQDYRKIFGDIDADNSGFITYAQFAKVMKKNTNLSPAHLSELFNGLDTDGDESIEYSEFLAVSLHFKKDIEDATLIEAFYSIDVNGNGTIEAADLVALMGIKPDEALKLMYEALGHRETADPRITKQQFLDLFHGKKALLSRFNRLVV